jgi:hypothetical protein
MQTPSFNGGSILTQIGRDTIHLFSHFFYRDNPTAIDISDANVVTKSGGSHEPGILGMGSGSTLLRQLVQLGMISGATYSLYLGTGFGRANGAMNGSNVFGGYDAARFKDKVHTYPMDLRSGSADYLPLNITDVVMTSTDMQQMSMVDTHAGDPSFVARITTDQYPMLLPAAISRKFKSMTKAQRSNHTDRSFLIDDEAFNCSMTIVLADGFNVTIPPRILRNAVNGLAAVAAPTANYTGPYYLGAAFLTQVYLMMDYEAEQFHIAKATKNPNFNAPETLCPGAIPFSRAESYKSEQRVNNRPKLLGAILGSTFGGLAILLVGWMVLLSWRKKKLAGDSEEGKLRHEPILFFSDPDLRNSRGRSRERDMSMGGESFGTVEKSRAVAMPIAPVRATPVNQPMAPMPVRRPTEASLAVSAMETETTPSMEIERPPELDMSAILRGADTKVHSPTVLQSPGAMIVSRSVSPVSVISRDSREIDREKEKEDNEHKHGKM